MPHPNTQPSPHDTYTSPLAARNASPEMCRIWSPRHKFQTWRKIWLAVAEAQYEVTKDWDKPLVTMEQIEELRANLDVTDDDLALAAKYEAELRHDVMAHVHAWGDKCPKARPIIHLGMTSQDVVCNADLIAIYEATELIRLKIIKVICSLSDRSSEFVAMPTLGFTHYQPAQPTTVGRRLAEYASQLVIVAEDRLSISFNGWQFYRGFRGATGTQASFLQLFDGSPEIVDRFEGLALLKIKGHSL
ncbi:MAG: lyase family protein, partial [Phycisphaerales bacterium JB061]